MIDISFFAQSLENLLNDEVEAQILAGNTTLDNGRVTYRFLIHTDGGEYKDYDYINGNGNISAEPTNKIVRYINCEFDTTGSQIDGVLSVEMSFNSRLEILVPLVNAGRGNKKLELINTIRQVIDNTFRLNSSGVYSVGDVDNKIDYNYGVIYQLAETGAREKRAEIGDSELMTAYLAYFLVQDGVNSADFKIYIDGNRVYFTRLGFNRGSTNESNVPSDSTNGAGNNVPSSSVFGLNFDMPTRTNGADSIISQYLFKGVNPARLVEVRTPFDANNNGNPGGTPIPNRYLMIFNEISNNAETAKFASTTVTMVEASEGLPLSPYAQQNWGVNNG